HGWRGRGWIGANRPYFDTRNNFYVNDQFRNIDVNRNVLNCDITAYRSHLEHNSNFRAKPTREARPQPAAPPAVAPPVPPVARPAPPPQSPAREKPQSPPPPPAVPPPHVAPLPPRLAVLARATPRREKPQPPPPPAAAAPPHVAPSPPAPRPATPP